MRSCGNAAPALAPAPGAPSNPKLAHGTASTIEPTPAPAPAPAADHRTTAAAQVALQRAKKAKVLRDEDGLSEIVSDLCVDKPEGSTEYPKYPGNPPLWGEMYRVREQKGRWRLLKLPKGAPMEEASGNSEYNYMVIKHSMIARA